MKIIFQTNCINCNGVIDIEYNTNGIIDIESILQTEFECISCGNINYYDYIKSIIMNGK